MYTNSSIPTRRGFDHWYGLYQGGATHFSHLFPALERGGIFDLHDDEVADRTSYGVYSAELYGIRAVQYILDHAADADPRPIFLYFALQNPHEPLESPPEYMMRDACANIDNTGDRRTFW